MDLILMDLFLMINRIKKLDDFIKSLFQITGIKCNYNYKYMFE